MKDEEGRKTPHPVALRDHPLPKVEGYEIFCWATEPPQWQRWTGCHEATRCLPLREIANPAEQASALATRCAIDGTGIQGRWSMASSYQPTGWVAHRMTLTKIPSADG